MKEVLNRTVLLATVTGCAGSIHTYRVMHELGEAANYGRVVLKSSLFALLLSIFVEYICRNGISNLKSILFMLGMGIAFLLAKVFIAV